MHESPDQLNNKRNEVAKYADPRQGKTKIVGRVLPKLAPLVINHESNLNQLLKAIELTPMEDGFKAIMRIRLLSPHPGVVLLNYANKHGIRFAEILRMEEYGKEKVMDFLRKNSIQDIIKDFNQNSRAQRDLKNELSKPVNPDIQAAGEGVQDG